MLSPHIIGGRGDGADFVKRTGAKWAKLVFGFDEAGKPGNFPEGTKFVGRATGTDMVKPIDAVREGSDPVKFAEEFYAAQVRPHLIANPKIMYWESGNEPVVGSGADGTSALTAMRWLAAFDKRFVQLCAADGRKAVIGNFSVGVPDLPEFDRFFLWREYLPALQEAMLNGAYLGLHEYTNNNPAWDTWLQYRHTWVLSFLDKMNLQKLRILITEAGTDSLPGGGRPWKDMFGGDVDAYATCMAGYVGRTQQNYPRVEAVFIFTYGDADGWRDHNLDGSGFTDAWLKVRPAPPIEIPPPPPPVNKATGIDVSRYQGTIDWLKVKSQGVAFAFIKATEGADYVDPTCVPNVKNAKIQNILTGIYHFYLPGVSPLDQAKNVLAIWKTTMPEMPIVVDLEKAPTVVTGFRTDVQLFVDTLDSETKKPPIIYTNNYFWKTYLAGTNLKRNPLWIANYTTGSQPLIPTDFSNWLFWQWTNKGDGSKYGVQSPDLDLDWFNGTIDQLKTLYGIKEPPPPMNVELASIVMPFKFFCKGTLPLYKRNLSTGEFVFSRSIIVNWTIDAFASATGSDGKTYWKVVDKAGEDVDEWMPALVLKPA